MPDIAEDILVKASEGDLESFEAIYKSTAGFVYNVALRVVSNREDAEEVVQEVFMIVYEKLKNFRLEASFKTWVYRITVNHAINVAKRRSKFQKGLVPIDDIQIEGKMTSDVSSHMDKEHSNTIVKHVLNQLNPDQRACIVLRSIEGLSYERIAQVLKIPINTVRSRIKRARETMLAARKEVILNDL